MRRHALIAAATTAVMCLTPAAVRAEPIVVIIESGSAQVGPGPDPVTLTGTHGFSLSASLDIGSTCLWFFCTVEEGEPLPMSGRWLGMDIRSVILTLDGVTYTNVGGPNDPGSLGLEFFGADPPAPAVQAGLLTVEAPFTFDALFRYPGPGPDPELLTAQIIGQGIATLTLSGLLEGRAHWDSLGIRWDFTAPRAVPEPALLSLAGLGVAGAWHHRRRRRVQRAEESPIA